MRRFLLIFLLLFTLFPGRTFAVLPQLELHLAPTTRVVFPNGLTLLVRERHDMDNVGIFLAVGAGQLTEEENEWGSTHFLQSYLLEVPVEDFHDSATAIESQGGTVSSSSGPDLAEIDLDITSGEFPFAMKVLSHLLHLQGMDEKVFNEVKESTLEDVQQMSEESYQFLYSLFLQEFYSYHPYKVPVYGLSSTIKSFTSSDLFNYYHHYYVPNNMVIAVVGNVETDRVIKLASKLFSDLERKTLHSKDIYYQPVLGEQKQIQLQQSGNVAWLFMGFSAPDFNNDDYPPMEVINSILGAGLSSRIWLSIREKRGLSYELGSQYSAREGPSHFIIYVATSPENLPESRDRLLKEVDRIRREPLVQGDMEITKRRLIGQFILSLETNLAQAKFLARSEILGKGPMYDETYIRLIQSVTPADILRVAKKYLDDYILISVE